MPVGEHVLRNDGRAGILVPSIPPDAARGALRMHDPSRRIEHAVLSVHPAAYRLPDVRCASISSFRRFFYTGFVPSHTEENAMPMREILSPTQRAQFTEMPAALSDRDVARYYTLSDADRAVIHQRRRSHNRLGFAVQLCYLRFPGRSFAANKVVPERVLAYIAAQLDLAPHVLQDYARARDATRREHRLEIQQRFGFRSFDAHV